MKLALNYFSPENKTITTETGFRYLSQKSVLKRSETIEGTKEEVFKKFYDMNRRLRYCNGSQYFIIDEKMKSEYQSWYNSLDEATKFSMYYGKGTVD